MIFISLWWKTHRRFYKILLDLKWDSFKTQAWSNAIFSPLFSLALVMPPLFDPSTIVLVSSSALIISLFTECKCSSTLNSCFLALIYVILFQWSTPDNTSRTFSSSVQIFIFIWLSDLFGRVDNPELCSSRAFFSSSELNSDAKKCLELP